MRVMSGRNLVVFVSLLLLPGLEARAGNESEILAQGSAALERKECDKAYWTLQRMPASGRTDGTWLLATARAAECLKRYDDALLFYRKYSNAEPGIRRWSRRSRR